MSRETKADHDHFHSPVTPAPWSLVHPSPSVPPSLRGPYGADRLVRIVGSLIPAFGDESIICNL